jgi:formylglycine-generating enzyme required for sulfatase activity
MVLKYRGIVTMKNVFILILVFLSFSCGESENKNIATEEVVKKKEIIRFKKEVTNFLGMKFVYIKPGTFDMGVINEPSVVSGRIRTITHRVTLTKGFYMQTTETTIGQFKEFIRETNLKTQAEKQKTQAIFYISYKSLEPKGYSWGMKGRSWKKPGYNLDDKFSDNHPVSLVSWEDAKAFIEWLNRKHSDFYRLPTEAEWEYSCRAGTKTNFANGDLKYTALSKDGEKPDPTLDKIGWYSGNAVNSSHPVGLKNPNPWGLYDMHGNVEEFCEDDYLYDFNNNVIDPLFKSKDKKSEIASRGGNWWYHPFVCTSSTRSFRKKNYCSNLAGFRVVKDTTPNDLKDEFKYKTDEKKKK